MCDITEDLKLCSCKDEAAPSIGAWSIKRYKDADWTELETGRCLTLHFDENDKSNIELIIDTLTNKYPFDFDYKPENGDILNISLNNNKRYEIEYTSDKWVNCEQLSDHLNKKIIIKKGTIKNSNTDHE